jgi:hypothetical protein
LLSPVDPSSVLENRLDPQPRRKDEEDWENDAEQIIPDFRVREPAYERGLFVMLTHYGSATTYL